MNRFLSILTIWNPFIMWKKYKNDIYSISERQGAQLIFQIFVVSLVTIHRVPCLSPSHRHYIIKDQMVQQFDDPAGFLLFTIYDWWMKYEVLLIIIYQQDFYVGRSGRSVISSP